METEEKKRERCNKRPDRDKKSPESGGRREKGLSPSLSFPRVAITWRKTKTARRAVLLTDDPHRRRIKEGKGRRRTRRTRGIRWQRNDVLPLLTPLLANISRG